MLGDRTQENKESAREGRIEVGRERVREKKHNRTQKSRQR